MINFTGAYSIFVLCLIGVLGWMRPAHCSYMPEPQTITQMVEGADSIAILRVDALALQKMEEVKPSGYTKSKDGKTQVPYYMGSAALQLSTFQPEGNYKFTNLRNIKGKLPPTFEVAVPPLLSSNFGTKFDINVGSVVIGFLKKNNSTWVPYEPLRPFVPVSVVSKFDLLRGENPAQQVDSLLLEELKSVKTRQMVANLLTSSVGPHVVIGVAPYIEDTDLLTRDYVLKVLAGNKQLSVINRIRDLNRITSTRGSNAISMSSLQNFSGMREALPQLNPLLFEDEQYIRINALDILSRTPDTSSLPFLLLTLYDSERQKINAPSAYALFLQLSGAKLTVDAGDFALHPDTARKDALAWWRDELAGKHTGSIEQQKEKAVADPQNVQDTKSLTQLNQKLFNRLESTRRAAVEVLGTLADESSTPYLLVSLDDPQRDIAYSSYRILSRLIPKLQQIQDISQFENQRELLTQAALNWWSKHLIEAEKVRIPNP